MEQLNHSLFLLINATPDSPQWLQKLAYLFAQWAILIVPLTLTVGWFWSNQRKLVLNMTIALAIALTLSKIISLLYPHARPFVDHFGYQILPHQADGSFPSDHATVMFTYTMSLLFWYRLSSAILALLLSIAISWSRIFLGVHWPLDIIGALLVALVACLLSQWIWSRWGTLLLAKMTAVYHLCLFFFIKRGWLKS